MISTTVIPTTATRSKASLILAAVLWAEFIGLAITGVWLWSRYVPTTPGGGAQAMRTLHQAFASITSLTFLAWAILSVIQRRTGRARIAVAVIGMFLAFGAAMVTGQLLPWDQLALWKVSVGTDFQGYRWLFDRGDDVRFVLIGSAEVGVATVRRVVVAHVGIGVLLAASFIGLTAKPAIRRARRVTQSG